MPGLFDDLIPQQGGSSAAPASAAPARGLFDDLIPAQPPQSARTIEIPETDAMGNPTGGTTTVETREGPQRGSAGWYVNDATKAAGAGLVKGLASVPGSLADLASTVQAGGQRLEQWWTGETPEAYAARVEERKRNAPLASLNPAIDAFQHNAGSQGITQAIEDNITGPLPHPETRLGRFVETATEFVPGAVALGPGKLTQNVGRKALAYGVAPGVTSEAAGQITEGTAAEPFARFDGHGIGPFDLAAVEGVAGEEPGIGFRSYLHDRGRLALGLSLGERRAGGPARQNHDHGHNGANGGCHIGRSPDGFSPARG